MTAPYRQHLQPPVAAEPELPPPLQDFVQQLPQSTMPEAAAYLRTVTDSADLAGIGAQAAKWRDAAADHLLVIGAGGSGLSGRALCGLKPDTQKRVHVVDSGDPETFAALLRQLPPSRTALLAVSKSGKTLETLAFMDRALAWLATGNGWQEQVGVIACADHNPLHAFAVTQQCAFIPHPEHLCGRYAIFSAVGLLPAAFAGLDIAAIKTGAAEMLADPAPAAQGAWWQYQALREGRSNHVLFAYGDRLQGFSRWWRQCVAESLGKHGKGITPLCAVGTRDQHSQLQLYLDGPRDKQFTLLTHDTAGTGERMSETVLAESLRGRRLGDLVDAQQRAVLQTLANKALPIRHIHLRQVDERAAGALVMQWMLEVTMLGLLLGVNPFDQPAIEESKKLTGEYLRGMPR